ncbi:hypothetical protein C0J52_06765, partial [Blattella germanica]
KYSAFFLTFCIYAAAAILLGLLFLTGILPSLQAMHKKSKTPYIVWLGLIPILILVEPKHVEEKVFEEQQSIFDGRDDSPKMKDISEMKYLDRVLKETMRMYAHVPFLGRELQEEIQLGKSHYYPFLQVFDPDRFLPENIATRHPYSYLPFSAGPRNCIGQRFCMLQAKVVLSYIVRHYELEATTGMPVLVPDIMNRAEDGVHVRIIKRIAS